TLLFGEELEACDGFAPDEVFVHDLVDVGLGDVAVPDALGIDHHAAAVLAVVQAPRLVGANLLVQPARPQRLLELLQQVRRTLAGAVAPRAVGGPLVETDEQVLLERRRHHSSSRILRNACGSERSASSTASAWPRNPAAAESARISVR